MGDVSGIVGQKSMEMNNNDGTCQVGCYHNGIGVEKDERKAFIYYQKSAEMSDVSIMVGYSILIELKRFKNQQKWITLMEHTGLDVVSTMELELKRMNI